MSRENLLSVKILYGHAKHCPNATTDLNLGREPVTQLIVIDKKKKKGSNVGGALVIAGISECQGAMLTGREGPLATPWVQAVIET